MLNFHSMMRNCSMKPRAYTLQPGSKQITTHSWAHCFAVAWRQAIGSQAAHMQTLSLARSGKAALLAAVWPAHTAWCSACWCLGCMAGQSTGAAWEQPPFRAQVLASCAVQSLQRVPHVITLFRLRVPAQPGCSTPKVYSHTLIHQLLTCQSGDPLPPHGGQPLPSQEHHGP